MPRFPNFGCPDDKTLRGVPDIAKRITRDQSPRRVVARLQHFSLVGFDDGCGLYLIFEFARGPHDIHFIALFYVSQLSKKSVAMTRPHQVAALARTSRASQVSHAARQR